MGSAGDVMYESWEAIFLEEEEVLSSDDPSDMIDQMIRVTLRKSQSNRPSRCVEFAIVSSSSESCNRKKVLYVLL